MSAVMNQFIEIKYLEADHHSPSHRTTFTLPNGIVALPNLRLANLGIHGAVGSLSATGITSLIKHIYLYSDGQLIDQLRYANQYESFRQLQHSNGVNKDQFRFLEKHKIGYDLDFKQQVSALKTIQNNSIVASSEKDAQGGYLQLPPLLRILQEQSFVIDTSKMPNFRLIIEWETSKFKYLSSGTNNTYIVGRPTLIYDLVSDPKAAMEISKSMNNFSWKCMEHDSINISNQSGNVPTTQKVNLKLKAFDNKYVNRIISFKNYTDLSIAQNGNNIRGKGFFRSPVMYLEKINFKVNGVPVFDQPVDREEVRQVITSQAWGPLNTKPYETKLSVGLDNPIDAQANFLGIPSDHADSVGMASYFGCELSNKVKDFEVEYERRCPEDDQDPKNYSQELTFNVFAEVTKQLIFGKDGFMIRYL